MWFLKGLVMIRRYLIGFCRLIWQSTWLRYSALLGMAGTLLYVGLWLMIAVHAYQALAQPPKDKADAALVLGSRAYLNGAPNPCLTGRIDVAVQLGMSNQVAQLVMSGGVDKEDGRVESQVMMQRARDNGYTGVIREESASSSTLENLHYSASILRENQISNVIVVSEPYHLWRIEKLVSGGHLGTGLNVQYAAAPSHCWRTWGMFFKGALREPLAVVNNYMKGYFD
jgi:uncharacterized SAM-binding protein YcdF (DUF218 family)